jgi:hypothetical protein
MALTRYDQRKSCEEVEANAIGTEYDRAGLLPPTDATAIRGLLRSYLDQRVLFYTTRDERRLDAIKADTARLQNELWSVVQARATAQATPMIALTASGMNDGFNSRGYTEASWLNRIPVAAWALMNAIAVCCNLLIGYNAQRSNSKMARLFILPMVVAISFLLIADLDSPRGGVIRILPHTLVSISNFQDPQ